MAAMRNSFFDLKFLVTLALALPAIAIAIHLSRPEVSTRGWAWLLLIPVGLLGIGIGGEMMMPQRLPMMTRLVGSNSRVCLTAIPLLSLPLLAGARAPPPPRAPARAPAPRAIPGPVAAGYARNTAACN